MSTSPKSIRLLEFLKSSQGDEQNPLVFRLWGDDDYLIELAVRKLKVRYLDADFEDFNLRTLRCQKGTNFQDLEALVGELPTMVAHRLVVIHDLENLGKKPSEAMARQFFDAVSQGTVTVLTHKRGGAENIWWSSLGSTASGCLVDCRLDDGELDLFLGSYCRQKQKDYEAKSLTVLRERVGSDVRTLISHLERCLLSLTEGQKLTPKIVEQLVPFSGQVAMWKMTAAIGRRDHRAAFQILDNQLERGEPTGSILSYLNSYLVSLVQIDGLRKDLGSPAAISRALPRKSEFQVKKSLAELSTWSPEDLEAGLEGITRADFRSKGGGQGGSNRLLLQLLILRLCSRKQRR